MSDELEGTEDPPRSSRAVLGWCLAATSLLALPFLVIRFPPITDLPQQVAQIRLLGQALASSHSHYEVAWWAPNRLSYALLAVGWVTAGPQWAGSIALALIAALWAWSFQAVARTRQRSVATALLVCVLFYNHGFYYGFLNFILGVPVFLLWWHWSLQPPDSRLWLEALRFLGGATLLYETHLLWLVVGLLWLPVGCWMSGARMRQWVARGLGAAPLALAGGAWSHWLSTTRFAAHTVWGPLPWQRLLPEWWVHAAFGGLRGRLEPMLLACLVLWTLAGLATATRKARDVDVPLITAGALLLLLAVLLPERQMRTIELGSRWVPAGLAFVVLALPAPRLQVSLRRILAILILALAAVSTAIAWHTVELSDLWGLRESLAALPNAPRLLGLNFLRTSATRRGDPYYHMFAWSQVLHGGSLNSSFARMPTSLVLDRREPPPWTRDLEYFSGAVQRRDFDWFDYVLVSGGKQIQDEFAAMPWLQPVTEEGLWRLYRVRPVG